MPFGKNLLNSARGRLFHRRYQRVMLSREHYNNGLQTRHCHGIAAIVPIEGVEVNLQGALRLGREDHAWVRIASRCGELEVRAKVTDRSQAGVDVVGREEVAIIIPHGCKRYRPLLSRVACG